jgi:Tol biopolymer transport system component
MRLMAGEIFISYRRADAAWARLLHSQLRAEGVEAWYDAQVGAGEDWRVATAKALEDSRLFVLLFSENAAQSSDIAKELAAAVLEKKHIVPVRLQNIAPKGAFLYELASRNWFNAYEDTEAKLAELAKGLAYLVHGGGQDDSALLLERAAAAPVPAAPAPRWTVESSRPFVSTFALEGAPAFSPDGKMLAYTSGPDHMSRNIYVRNVARGDGIRITNDPYDDISPSWSSDGTRIAYIARKTGEPCRIMLTSVPAGEVREVARCAHAEISSVCWQPGTQFLYYFDHGQETLDLVFRLDLDSGARLQLPRKASNPMLGLTHLECSPDGKSLLVVGGVSASTFAMLIHDLASGEERILGKMIIAGSATWTEDSRAVIASAASGIGSQITAYPLDGSPSYRVYATATRVGRLAAGSGGLLALETDSSRENLARAVPAPRAQSDIIDAARGRSWSPSFAPDGTLAFLSNRSSTNAIWVMKPGAAPAMLFDAGLSPLFRLEYSPDGTRLAGAIGGPDSVTIKIFTADGGIVQSFDSPTLGTGAPTWTADGKNIVLFDKRVMGYVRIDIANPADRLSAAPPFWSVIFHGEGTFAARFDKPGFWQIDKEPRLISSKYPGRWSQPAAFRGEDLLIPDFKAPDGARILAQPLAGGPDRVLAYAPGAQAVEYGLESKMAVNPKTGEIIYVAAVQGDTNIDLLSLVRH